eukprot:g2472.t1
MDSPAVENSGLSRKLSRLQHLQERGAATPAGPPPSKWSAQAAKFRRRLGYYVPVLGWLPKYSFAQDGLDDFVAGLTASVILIPQGITYAGLANLSPIHGLYTAFFPLLGYFVFGSGKHLSVGPEVTASILVGKSILNFPSVKALNPNSEAYDAALLSAAMALTFTVSLVGLVMGFLRMGFVDSMLSRPILAGFVQAVAAILIMDQLPFLLGLPCKDDHCSPDNTPFDLLMYTFKNIKEVNWPTVAISASSITTMLAFPSIKRRCPTFKPLQLFPEVLLVVGAATFVSWHFKLQDQGVKVLGHMEGGFSLPHVPDMRGRETIILTDAMTIMLLGFVESQIANKKCGAKHGYTVSPNRELVALGISNFFGSFFGAFCAFGSIPRTEMMMARGQKSNVASIWAAIIVGLAILFVLPLFHYTPKAVTGSIIFVVALGLVEVHELKFIVRVRKWVDLAMAFLMTLVTLVWGIDMGVFFAFGSCLLMAVKQTTLPSLTVLGRGDNDGDYRDLMDLDEHTKKIDGVLIYKVDGALFFANAQKLKESTQRMEKWGNMHVHPSEDHVPLLMSAVIFDVSQLISVDATALATLLEIVESYTVMNRRVAFVGLRKRLCSLFQRAGILDHVRQDDLFNSLPAAVAAMTAKSGTAKSTPLKIPAAAPTPRPVTSDAGSGASGDDEEDDDTDCEDRSRKRSSAKHKRASRQSERPTPTKGSSEGSQSHPNVLDFWSWPILRMMNLTWADDHAEDVMAENAGVYGDQAMAKDPPRHCSLTHFPTTNTKTPRTRTFFSGPGCAILEQQLQQEERTCSVPTATELSQAVDCFSLIFTEAIHRSSPCHAQPLEGLGIQVRDRPSSILAAHPVARSDDRDLNGTLPKDPQSTQRTLKVTPPLPHAHSVLDQAPAPLKGPAEPKFYTHLRTSLHAMG